MTTGEMVAYLMKLLIEASSPTLVRSGTEIMSVCEL
jgi:hypothetical protein